ncbi:tandem-95 repeat protein [Aquabacterium soli]|uniref:Tandem-95 repeat protein n=1 Tax=Aquabacterium soli TaxID=2493092 RepID=A0A426VAV5_9BURK|nr:tandem-95 repeat protein [Aquabacterium soli]RRS04077.1 tandem-95 repeat protein [Aquabacterium soli]
MVTTTQVPVGTVSSLKGNVSVTPANGGPARPLQVGDVIHPGDRIISAAGAQIQVTDTQGALWTPRDIAAHNAQAEALLAEQKADATSAKTKAAATVLPGDNIDDVIAAVNNGNADDATAAGLAGGGGGSTLGEGLRVDRVNEGVNPQEFTYGTDDRTQAQAVQAAEPPQDANDAPVITDTPTDPDRPTTSFDPNTGNYQVTTPEDTPVSGQVKATDADGDPLTYALGGTAPAHGTVVVNADGTWTYTPGKDYNGADSFTVLVSDGRGGTATSTVSIGVTPVNDPPVITDDPTNPNFPGTTFDPTTGDYKVTTPEDTSVSGQVKATDVDGDTLTYTLGKTSPEHGTVVVNADGTWTYTPSKDYNGSDVFTVLVSDGNGGTATSTVNIGVTPVNDPPKPEDPDNPTFDPATGNYNVTTDEDTPVSGQVKATDADGDTLTYTLGKTSPAHGTVVVNADGTWTYTPSKDYNGSDVFTVLVSDGNGGTATSTVNIGVTPVNDPPKPEDPDNPTFDPATGNYNVTTDEDTPVSGQVKATDADGDTLTYTLGKTSPAHGTVVVNADGTWTYTPSKDYNGSDVFTVTVSDGHGGTATSTVNVGINPVNDPPVLTDPNVPGQDFDPTTNTYKVTTSEDATVVGKVAATDVDGDTLTFTKGNDPTHGTVEVAADGSYTYTPGKDYSGSDSFTVVVDDGHGGKVSSTVTVNIAPVADIPVVTVSLGNASADVVAITKDNATATDLGFKVTATNFDGSVGTVSTVNGINVAGFGVAGSVSADTGNDGEPPELGHDRATQTSEKLSIALDHPASSATVQFSWLSPTEHAAYTLYDASGNVIGSGVVTGITDQIDPAITLKADNGASISRIDFTAPGSHDDYIINNVTYVASESIPITVTATPTDIDHSEHVSALVISVPSDATLSVGTKNADGTWTLPLSSSGDYQVSVDPVTHAVTLTGLVMTLPSDHVGDVKVTVTATVYDTVSSVTAQGSGSAENNVPVLTDPDVPGQSFDPTTGNYKAATPEDTPVSGRVKATDADGDTLTYTLGGTSPAHGTVVVNTDGTWTYTPAKDYNGSDVFTVLVNDGHGGKATSTITIGVTPVNDPPVITDTPTDPNHPGTTYDPTTGNYKATTPEDTAVSGQVKATDVDGDTLTYTLGSTKPAHGTVVVNADGTWTYTPSKDYNGNDSFTVLVDDGHGGTATSTVKIGVTPVNDNPTPQDPNNPNFDPTTGTYSVTTPEDTPVKGQVKATDVDGDTLTFKLGSTTPTHGTVVVNADGTWTYTPNKDYNGNDSFTVLVDDGHGGTATSTVKIGVTPVNDNPTPQDPNNPNFDPTTGTYSVTTPEDTPVKGQVKATDVDGDTLTFKLGSTTPTHGTVVVNADGTWTYTPSKDYNGNDSFTVLVDDGHGGTATSTVKIGVTPVNDPPVITDTPTDPNRPGTSYDPATGNYKAITPEDTPVSGQVKATDADGDVLTYALGGTSPAHGTVVVNANGTWTYTPAKDYNGSDVFTVLVSDGQGGTATSTVTIGVTPANDPPKPEDPTDPNFDPVTGTYSVTTPEDTPVKGQVKATDADGDPLTYTLGGTTPAHGTVVVNTDGTWTYTPGKDYNGSDVFTVSISDGHGGTATSTVKVGVTPVNDNPTATPDHVTVAEDSIVTFDPRTNDSDVDGDSLSITAVNGSPISTTTPVVLPEGTISLNGNGTLTFTPAPNYNGTLSLSYTLSDGHGGTAQAPITIDVTPVDDVAMVGSGSASLSEEGLSNGIADSTGSPDTTNATSASGKLSVTDADGGNNTITLSGPSGLTSGGSTITWSGTGTVDNPLVGSASGKTIITASIDSNGNYQVSLQGPVDHANTTTEDVRSIQLTVQASNGVSTSTSTLTLNVEDDSPASGNQTQYISPATQSTNVMLVVDVSGSMENALADKTVNGLKATIKGLLDHYGELGDVRVQIVTFSDSASARATWMTLSDAKTFVDKLSANGGTNYDAALASAQTGFNASGKLAGAVNVSYFFSDGEPTKGREVDTGSDKTKWEAFLKANDIDSYAMGINGASSSNLKYLEPIAYNGASETERPAVILTSNTAVKTYLDNSVVTVEHGSLSGLAGADGLKAVTAFSATNQTSSTYDAATGIQTITLSSGSRIELNLATGEYTYTRPAGNTGDTFSYTIVDKDGDKGSGTLTLTTVNHAPEGTDGTVSLAEDTTYHLQVSDFGFKDSDTGDRLSVVRIDTLPTDGQLSLNGKAVVAGQVIAASDIGSLVFKPDANENGSTYAKMTFSVADRAGVYDTTPNTLTFNVTPVNDAPLARIASHGGLLGLVDVSVDPILNFSSHQHLGVYDVDNNLTRIDLSVKNLLSVGGLANDILGLIGLGGDHSKLTIDTALAQSYGFNISGNDTRHIVITSATAGGTVDYALVNKLLATLVYDPAELLGVSADLLPTMTIKATDAYGLSSTDTASAGLISVHVDTIQDVLDTKVDVSLSATVDSAVTLTHDALTGEFTHAIDVGLSVSTPLTLTGHSASSDVFAWSLSDQGTATASTGTNGTTVGVTHAVDTIVDFDTVARSAGGDVLDLRDLLSGEHTVGGTGNLSQFLDFDTTSQPGSTVVHVSTTGGFTAGYDAKAEDQTIVLQNVNLRGDLGLGASASDNQVIAELMTRGKLLVDNH